MAPVRARTTLSPRPKPVAPGPNTTHLAESGGDFLELCQGDEPVPVPVKDLESRPKVLTSNPSCSDVELDVVQIYSCLCAKLGNRSDEAMKRCDEALNASSLQFLCQR